MLNKSQRGAVLITTLTFLVIITLISVVSMRSSTSELRLATNTEDQLAAREVAQAAIDAVINEPANFVVKTISGTTSNSATFSGVSEFTNSSMAITQLDLSIPPRGLGVSSKFQTALFGVNSSYNGVSSGRGQAQVEQGVLLLVPMM